MNNTERAQLAIEITSAMENAIIKGNEHTLLGNELALVGVANDRTYIKNSEKFIIALLTYGECNVFYKCLLRVKDSENTSNASVSIKLRLLEDIKLYLEEGLTDRLQLQVDIHNEIMATKHTPPIPCLQHPIVLDNIRTNVSRSNINKYTVLYKSRKSMRVVNTVPIDMAYVYGERYCVGDRDIKVTKVIRKLELVLNTHNKLYLNHILTKYLKTGCMIKAITHGIKEILPKPISLHELEKDLWESVVLATIEDIRSYHTTLPLPTTSHILKEITSKFKGGSSFTTLDLTSATLGYNDIKTTNLVAQAVSIIHKGSMRNYFTSCG